MRQGRQNATSKTFFTTSWDDGSFFDPKVAELLERFEFRGTFYASTGPGGRRALDDEGMRRIAAVHEFGNHGRSHTVFTTLTADEIEAELAWARADLSRFGDSARIVAPPRGKLDRRVLATLRRLGYGIRSAPILAAARPQPGILEPSFLLYPHGCVGVLRNVLRRRALPATPLLLAWARGGDLRERALRLLRVTAERDGYVHVWGHADEVERLGHWEALHDLLAAASALGVRPVTNGELLDELRGRPEHIGI